VGLLLHAAAFVGEADYELSHWAMSPWVVSILDGLSWGSF
jgi:hypothetical protein